jgi:hypothetical protein
MYKNYGLDIALEISSQDGTEWQLGAVEIAPLFTIPNKEDRLQALPKGEIQRGKQDMKDCATRGPINLMEAYFTYGVRKKLFDPKNEQWLRDKGYVQMVDGLECVLFSDAFIAIKSGTRKTGNSMKAPIHAIHEHGLLPKHMLPLDKSMTWDEYHNPNRITQEMVDLARIFSKRFSINYVQVPSKKFIEANEEDYIVVAGHAWNKPVRGIYTRTEDDINHVWLNVHPAFVGFDNYIDSTDGDFLKQIAHDYIFRDWGYRMYVSAENPNVVDNWFSVGFLTGLILKLQEVLGLMQKTTLAPVNLVEPKPEVVKTSAQKIYEYSVAMLGKEMSPADLADDEVGCAESYCNAARAAYPDMPIILSTATLLSFLRKDKRFKQTLDLKPGNVLIAATGTGNGTMRGHVWVIGTDNKAMSNDSATGLWKENYTIDQIVTRWRKQGGMQLFCFEPQ